MDTTVEQSKKRLGTYQVRYAKVNNAWPARLPTLTEQEAASAARRLYRMAFKRPFKGEIRQTSGRRYNWIRRGVLYVNAGRGWHHLVHDLSHYAHSRLNPGLAPHHSKHASIEAEMRAEVLKRGWLDGKLKRPEKPEPTVARPSLVEQRAKRAAAALARAEHRLKLAQAAIRRLRPKVRYYERKLAA